MATVYNLALGATVTKSTGSSSSAVDANSFLTDGITGMCNGASYGTTCYS
jgi:hypothetical protein